ncbi:MAG: YgfZ/GcvT domain-containing protein [Phycisphaerae bacterium]
MRENPLYFLHEQANASYLPYGADIQIIESFGEPEVEYAAIRKTAAIMDAPQRGVVELTGKDRLSFLHNLLTNDVKSLTAGKGCYAYLLNPKGRIVLDVNVLQVEDTTLLEVDARLADTLCRTLDHYLFSASVQIRNGTDDYGRLTLLGPDSGSIIDRIMGAGVTASLTGLLRSCKVELLGTWCTIFRNDQCGETQYELIAPRPRLPVLWTGLLKAANGAMESVDFKPGMTKLRPIGWSAYNIARIEAGTPLFDIDITNENLPMETAHWYPRAVHFSKGCYPGQEVVARMHVQKAMARCLVGLKNQGEVPPVAGEPLRDGESVIGMVTSSCMSPMLGNQAIALGYVKQSGAEIGRLLTVYTACGEARTMVTKLPFWPAT